MGCGTNPKRSPGRQQLEHDGAVGLQHASQAGGGLLQELLQRHPLDSELAELGRGGLLERNGAPISRAALVAAHR